MAKPKKAKTFTLWTKRFHDGGPWKSTCTGSEQGCKEALQEIYGSLRADAKAKKSPYIDRCRDEDLIKSHILESSQHPERHSFKVGDGASYGIRGDAYPCEVVKVSPSGKTITVVSVSWKYTGPPTKHGIWIDHGGLAEGLNCMFTRTEGNDYSGKTGTIYRWSKKSEGFKGDGRHLSPGYFVKKDPHY